eukprot:CAMPEP_0167761158 /NCGR_PEP_ID=MMETSP0110_2-20121227/12007_1 /TAXON_ID=629695 /ORGANISM="Gymnochlora sp., Strain CCMP2014" /LENGTH=698 /DNA_ID=CAMNT_0007647791 /DNA_START=83 /DNA_END=2175 /DNA_ORIENTATION=-
MLQRNALALLVCICLLVLNTEGRSKKSSGRNSEIDEGRKQRQESDMDSGYTDEYDDKQAEKAWEGKREKLEDVSEDLSDDNFDSEEELAKDSHLTPDFIFGVLNGSLQATADYVEDSDGAIEDFEQQRKQVKGRMQYTFSTAALIDRYHDYVEQLQNVTRHYLDAKRRKEDNRDDVSLNHIMKLRRQKRFWQRRRRKLYRVIRSRPDNTMDIKPHQRRKKQEAGGLQPEDTYMQVFCNNHIRWKEDEDLPGNFVRYSESNEYQPLKLHYKTKKLLPSKWDRNVWREGNTAVYRVRWNVSKNTETAKQILQWFKRACHKTADTSAMIAFDRQYNLWYNRKLELSKAAKELDMRVIWPIRSKRQNTLYILKPGFNNLDGWKAQEENYDSLKHPLEDAWKEYRQNKNEKFERDRSRWSAKIRNTPMVPVGYRLPLSERQMGYNWKDLREIERLWNWIQDAGLDRQYKLEGIKYLYMKKLIPEGLTEEAKMAVRRGKLGERVWNAVYDDKPKILKWALGKNPDLVNYVGRWLEPAVFTAARLNRTECLRVLLEYGADLNVTDSGFWGFQPRTPIEYAEEQGYEIVVGMLQDELERRQYTRTKSRVNSLARRQVDGRMSVPLHIGQLASDRQDDGRMSVPLHVGQLASDVQALSLTDGAQKVLRDPETTMPLDFVPSNNSVIPSLQPKEGNLPLMQDTSAQSL